MAGGPSNRDNNAAAKPVISSGWKPKVCEIQPSDDLFVSTLVDVFQYGLCNGFAEETLTRPNV